MGTYFTAGGPIDEPEIETPEELAKRDFNTTQHYLRLVNKDLNRINKKYDDNNTRHHKSEKIEALHAAQSVLQELSKYYEAHSKGFTNTAVSESLITAVNALKVITAQDNPGYKAKTGKFFLAHKKSTLGNHIDKISKYVDWIPNLSKQRKIRASLHGL